MINSRETIYASVDSAIKDLRMLGKYDTTEFKKIMYAIILNDMKEWQEYIPDMKRKEMQQVLDKYLIKQCAFSLKRFTPEEDLLSYRNVNTPQNNDTWSRIWDKDGYKEITSVVHKFDPVEGVVDMSACTELEDGALVLTDCNEE